MENIETGNTQEINGADVLNAILTKTQNNQSGKATVTQDEIMQAFEAMQAMYSENERLRNMQALQTLTKRPVGRPATKERVDLSAVRSDCWFMKKNVDETQWLGVQDALERYGLAWELQTTKAGNFFNDEWQEVPNRYNVTRLTDGKVFRNVSEVFAPMQNNEAFAVLDDIIRETGYKFSGFQSFNDGERITAILHAGKYEIAGSEHESKFTISIGHSGKLTLSTGRADFVQVCTNGLHRWQANNEFEAKIKQTKNAGARLQALNIAILSAMRKGVTLKEEMQLLASKQVTNEVAKQILLRSLKINSPEKLKAFEEENKEILSAQQINMGKLYLQAYLENWSNVPNSVINTEYSVLNASTFIDTHHANFKTNAGETTTEALFRSQAFGASANHSELVMELLLANKDYKENQLVIPVSVS